MGKPPGTEGTGLSAFRKPHSGLCSVPASPLIVKESRVVQGADGTERFHRNTCRMYVPDRIFSPFQTDFLILQSVSIFKFLLWELDWHGSKNKCKQTTAPWSAFTRGHWQAASVSPCSGRDSRIEVKRPLCWPDSSDKRQKQGNLEDKQQCVCSKRKALWPCSHGNGEHQEKWI